MTERKVDRARKDKARRALAKMRAETSGAASTSREAFAIRVINGSWRSPGLKVVLRVRAGTDQLEVLFIERRDGRRLSICPHCNQTWWLEADENLLDQRGLSLECRNAIRDQLRLCSPKELPNED